MMVNAPAPAPSSNQEHDEARVVVVPSSSVLASDEHIDVVVLPAFPPFPTTMKGEKDGTVRRNISWDTTRNQLRFTTPEGVSLKRTTGAFDDDTTNKMKDDVVETQQGNDRVSDDGIRQPPPEKKMRNNMPEGNVEEEDSPLAVVEIQPRGRPRKNSQPSHEPAAALVQQQPAQPSLADAVPSVGKSASGKVNSNSGYRGVSLLKGRNKFEAWVYAQGNSKRIYLGIYDNAEEAAFVRDRAWRDVGKDLSMLNFNDEVPIPQEYLASVANASKMVASHTRREAEATQLGVPRRETARREHESAPAPAPSSSSAPPPTIVNNNCNNYNYNIYGAATLHITHTSSAAGGMPTTTTTHHVAQAASPPPPQHSE